MKLSLIILALLTSYSVHARAADKPSSDLTEGVFVEDENTADDLVNDDKKDEQPKIESDLKPEADTTAKQQKPIEDSTEEITKDIVEDPEAAPPPEFPYPGATEEGFEQRQQPATLLTSQDTPVRLTQPLRRASSGEYFYGFKSSPEDSSSSLRFGYFGAPDIVNPLNGAFFQDIYENSKIPTLFFDYEWMFTHKFGVLGFKLGTGLFLAQGTGKFEVDRPERANRTPVEKYSFAMLPNMANFIYRFQYYDNQPIVPYAEGGGGYFTFAELRDDGKGLKIGGALIATAAGGVAFLMDWLDPQSIRQLDNDWGINHVWLVGEYRLIQGLNKEYDFTSTVINAGLRMEF